MDANMKQSLSTLRETLEGKKGFKADMIIGLDGFVDEIVHVVDKRQDFDTFTRVSEIAELGQRIKNAAGLSTNIEFVVNQTKLGGNGPILANALIEYGVDLTYIGAIGNPDIHPVFKPMAEKSKQIYNICEPAHTDALEFEDGKLMLGKLSVLNSITWDHLKNFIGGAQKIAEMIDNCDLFGMENWTMIPYMSDIWKKIIEEVFPLLKQKDQKSYAFFDLADPEKRTKEDILEAMRLIGCFEQKFKTILGLNEKELYEIAEVFDIAVDASQPNDAKLKATTEAVYSKLGIYCLVVHPTKEACCVIDGKFYQAYGPYCPKPVLTTGAGDNFNAGFCMGQTLGLDPLGSLLMGVSTSGFYVRNAKSPTYNDILTFITDWEAERV